MIFLIVNQATRKVIEILEASSLDEVKYHVSVFNTEVAIYKIILPQIGTDFDILNTPHYMRVV